MALESTWCPREGLDFLAELPSHDKDWFAANRAPYDECIAAPAKVFVDALGERLQDEISPAIVVQPKVNGAISPINRDVRFSADKTPYKDHLLLKWWEGEKKKLAPTLYVRLGSASVGFGSGAMFDSVDRWCEAVDDEKTGASLLAALEDLAAGRELDVAGAELKRVPARMTRITREPICCVTRCSQRAGRNRCQTTSRMPRSLTGVPSDLWRRQTFTAGSSTISERLVGVALIEEL
jgi:uncharacterized protein (TIGR02453 family)